MGERIKRYPSTIVLGIILAVGLFVRLHGLMNPLLDDQGWRQADTAGMATHMLGRLTQIPEVWFPMLNYDGAVPQKVELEFPILPYLLAWTWSLTGWADFWGRLWSIGFSLLTIWGVYVLGRFCFSSRAGLWAAAIYALLPLAVYYGRVVMPEPVAQACTVWALNGALFLRKRKSGRERFSRLCLFSAGGAMALAVLAKLPQLMIFPVALIFGFWPFKGQGKRILIYSVVALIPPLFYYGWVHAGASQASQFVSGILSGQVIQGPKLFWPELKLHLREGIGMPVEVFAGAGLLFLLLFSPQTKGSLQMPLKKHLKTSVQTFFSNPVFSGFLLWVFISWLYVWKVCLRIPLDYYLVPVLLPLALITGFALAQIQDTPGFVIGVLLLMVLAVNGALINEKKYAWDERYLTQAVWIRKMTPRESVLVLSDPPPMTFYYAQRTGYRLIEAEDGKAWEQLLITPGDYLVVLPNTTRNEEFWQKVKVHFRKVGPGVYQIKGRINGGE